MKMPFKEISLEELNFLAQPAHEDLQEAYVDSLAVIHDLICSYGYEREPRRLVGDPSSLDRPEIQYPERKFESYQGSPYEREISRNIAATIKKNQKYAIELEGKAIAETSENSQMSKDEIAYFQSSLLKAFQIAIHFDGNAEEFPPDERQ